MLLKAFLSSASHLYPDLGKYSVDYILENAFWVTPPLAAIFCFNDKNIFELMKKFFKCPFNLFAVYLLYLSTTEAC